MTLKKTLSFLLVLTLALSVLAPCGSLLQASAVTPLYGENELEQVVEPVIGESYYLGADVEGTMMYFRHGTVTDTVPYSLVTTDNINHSWCFKLTLENSTETSENFEGGFQLCYANPTNDTLTRIYCMDVLKDATVSGQTGVMDTGVNTAAPYKNRHSFHVANIEGKTVLQKYGNDNVLVIKQLTQTVNGEEVLAWRMLGVPATELSNDGVYPVMLLTEHNHSYGTPVADAASNSVSRTCDCGQSKTVYDQKVQSVNNPVIGNQYYLTANVDGTIRYFIHGTVSETSPASLRTSDDFHHNWSLPFTLEAPVEGDEGFQLIYTNPTNGNLARIYCYDSIGSDGVADTGVNSKSEVTKHTFTIDGSYIKNLGNDHILVVKEMAFTRNVTDEEGNTTVQEGTELRILGVPATELENEGVYPVFLSEKHTHIAYGETYQISDKGHAPICWCGGYADAIAHTYGAATKDAANNTASRTCTVCGYTNVVYGDAAERVFYPAIGGTYYLAANVGGTLKYFTKDGSVTATAPYSLSTTERTAIATQVTLENSTATSENFEGGFQFVFDNNGTTTRIYCMDVLKNATTPGQTGIMDTGMNSTTPYKNRHSFFIDELNGEQILRKYGNNNILAVELNATTNTYRMRGVTEAELANTGVYPVVLMNAHEHTYGAWSFDTAAGTQSRECVLCGNEEILCGTNSKVYPVEAPAIGESYYLVANVAGTLKYFTTGTVTNTAPYSLVTTERVAVAVPVTLENSTATSENFEGGFQFTFDNNGTTTRIYCMDVLKDATTPGQTGIMDTGTNSSTPYKNRHSFFIDELNGEQILRKYGNNNILAVELNATTNTYRMRGVTEAELANEGVYPAFLATAHTHAFGTAVYGDATGHWTVCDCGGKSATEKHTVESWTVITPPTATETGSKSGVCTVCGETAIVETPVTVSGWNIVLGDTIGVNFVLALAEGDIVTVTVGGEAVPAELTSNGNGTYKVFINLAAAQMSDEIVISVNGYAVEKTYSVRAYADVILAGDYTSYTKALVQNMLVYGGAAQSYFAHNTENLASNGIEVTAAVPEEAPELVILDELDSVSYYGASLLHKDKTAVRFYFTADSVENLTFQVDGNIYEPISKDGMHYIEVAGINPQDLDDTLNAVVTDGENSLAVQYSPLIYISRMYNKTSTTAATKAVAQAMYGYHLAAKAYLANLNLADDFALQSQNESTLYEGVTLYEKTYVAAGYGEVEAYALVIDAQANVELKVSAGAWDETNNADNPAEVKTVANHFRAVKNSGYNVLAMINGGFFDLNNTKSYLPYGAQIVDGVVKQAPSTDNNYSDNWFGMTKDGKYVISNAAGYADYEGNVQQAVGGGKLLIVDGVPVELTSDRAYRTAVGVNADGDLVMVAVADATYSDVCHIFVDMGLEITTVLNLDGGGSTAMYVPGAYYPKALILGDDGFFPREVADAVAIVEKQ